MKKKKILTVLLAAALSLTGSVAQTRQLTVDAGKPGGIVQPTMYGIFFEDINFGADGGLYAEMVMNRNFEFPNHLQGWNTFGKVTVGDFEPAFTRNPHYVTVYPSGHKEKTSGLENKGFFGMGFKKGMKYDFTVYARLNNLQGKTAKIRVELVGDDNVPMDRQVITLSNNQWQKKTVTLTANRTMQHGLLRIFNAGSEAVDLDYVSLFPEDNWHGLRADLVKDLEDLHPGIFRFPGGCIVEGTDLQTRYQWKNTIGDPENRPINENRWNYTFPHRQYADYYQSYGLGFYEYFLLAEKIGAEPLPVLSCGLACQFQNADNDSNAHVALKDLQPYVDDALDLIEFCNGDVNTKWGKIRARLGHPKPFNLKQIGIGNEQWGPLYAERLEVFVKQIRAKYPNIKICGTSGPSADGKDFDYGWQQMRKLNVDLVDEHYYKSPQWFLDNAGRYDKYDRRGPKVFAGEYAAHGKGERNNWEAALSEACFMTGLERNADVVYQATYAPLFAHVDGWQWKPDLIWFDNLNSVRSANWYVQMLYGTHKGTNMLKVTENGANVEGSNGLYASAVYDKIKKQYIVKVGNSAANAQQVTINLNGVKNVRKAQQTILKAAALTDENTIDHPDRIVPTTTDLTATGNTITVSLPASSFSVFVFE
ncbi:MAG: alpha-L-arabinofuranosidase C-terminal domain-containing protein [Prevotella sp.]|uniref:alpha-L-arabinofuranosidase C-terminal domain-containing protein n=1 Tax=Prevotella sp. TaxID=59823 RepID=UPI00258D2843|nr:alpha-L-arabinofuranosidase C-terminal domain-containing protein [Prevotella sp.]MDD6853589.1 alpha-L-arabinofuranosidase C-terminal domain-containing protein [Prevotella sp.]